MISIGSKRLTSKDFARVLYNREKVELDADAVSKVKLNFDFFKILFKGQGDLWHQYSFGPMAQYKIGDNDQRQLQYNLIKATSSGSGYFPGRSLPPTS